MNRREYFKDLPIGEEELEAVSRCLREGTIRIGKYVDQFEQVFSSYCGVHYGVGVFNGTAAIHLALATLGIGPGDEVIVPSLTFVATMNPVQFTGATPIFADNDPHTLCMTPQHIEENITSRTKAIVPVHLYGNPCAMDEICEIAEEHDLYVIEDAAESHGAKFKGKRTGSFSDISCFSFYANKLMTTGEGGMCLTDNLEWNDRMRLLRSQGKKKREELKGEDLIQNQFVHDALGFNYRMTNIQAAIGLVQMKKLEGTIEKSKQIKQWYEEELSSVSVRFQQPTHHSEPVVWMIPIFFDDEKTRSRVGKALLKAGIGIRSIFFPCHLQHFYDVKKDIPNAQSAVRKGIIVPGDLDLSSQEVHEICNVIKSAIHR